VTDVTGPVGRRSGTARLRSGAGRLRRVGFDPLDSRELRARKSLLVATTVLVQPAALFWGGL
jgi:hypothetical protein